MPSRAFKCPFLTRERITDVFEIVFPGADIVQWLMKNLSIEDPGRFFVFFLIGSLSHPHSWITSVGADLSESAVVIRTFSSVCDVRETAHIISYLIFRASWLSFFFFIYIYFIWGGQRHILHPPRVCSLHSRGHARRQPDSSSGVLLPDFWSRPHPQRRRHLLSFSGERATPLAAARPPTVAFPPLPERLTRWHGNYGFEFDSKIPHLFGVYLQRWVLFPLSLNSTGSEVFG